MVVFSRKARERRYKFPPGSWFDYYCQPSSIPTRPYYAVLSNSYPSQVFSNKVVFVGSKMTRLNPDELRKEPTAGLDVFKTPYSRFGFAPAPGIIVNATSYLNLKRGD